MCARAFSFFLSLVRDDAIASQTSDLSTAKMVAASNITIATSQRPHPHRQPACQRMSGKKDERGLEGRWEERREGWGMNNYTGVLPPMSLQRQYRTANHKAMRRNLITCCFFEAHNSNISAESISTIKMERMAS